MPRRTDLTSAQDAVARLLRAGSCVRTPDESRFAEGSEAYKKGWEVRIYVDWEDLDRAGRVLRRARIQPGRPYQKSSTRWILPVYGYEQVRLLRDWAGT